MLASHTCTHLFALRQWDSQHLPHRLETADAIQKLVRLLPFMSLNLCPRGGFPTAAGIYAAHMHELQVLYNDTKNRIAL